MASKTFEEKLRVEEGHGDENMWSGQEVEEYDCGCEVHFRQLDYGEAGEELPRRSLLVSDYLPCKRHEGTQTIPPRDARLVKVRREHESFLNE